MEFPVSSFHLLPEENGIYMFLDSNRQILYVGKAKNLKKRVSSYFQKFESLIGKTRLLVESIVTIRIQIVESEIEALLLEINFIKKFKPKFNIILKDDKTYPFIKITIGEEFPKILTVRKVDDWQSFFFGPFPNVGEMRMVLKIVRRIFPFISSKHRGNQICLYHHLGLCPCPATLVTSEQKKEYKKTIRYIVKFLNGESKKIIKELEKERNQFAKNEEFEIAGGIQKKVDAIIHVTSPVYKPFVYEQNPEFVQDLRLRELCQLQEILKKYYPKLLPLERIECYDISNISGVYATGSMIVFSNGEKDGSEYRKFRINMPQKTGSPNDFAMMSEVLSRRFKRTGWQFPNLIIVDGGKGQISSASKVLNQYNLNIPLISLAKREEVIITSDFKEIRLPKDSPALQLIMRIRNEAHRFAITYHRKLRSLSLQGTSL